MFCFTALDFLPKKKSFEQANFLKEICLCIKIMRFFLDPDLFLPKIKTHVSLFKNIFNFFSKHAFYTKVMIFLIQISSKEKPTNFYLKRLSKTFF